MKYLVIIPTTMHNYSFSAPLAWMFSRHTHKISGIFGFELNEDLVKNHDGFIIELNWFIELTEFQLLVEYIKKINKHARILFGGLYASLKYREIFRLCDVDYFIKGDNELPMTLFLEGEPPEKIPNMIGKNFENPITYIFTEEEYKDMDFSLDWFPSYLRTIQKGQMYQLPMLFTAKGGCGTVHQGCDYCMGSKYDQLKNIYNRPPLHMKNDILMELLAKIAKKFTSASLFICSRCHYDFSPHYFDTDMHVEIDSPVAIEKIGEILHAFKKCLLNISVYEEGLCGEVVRNNFREILSLEDPDHQIRFFAFDKEASQLDIPEDHLLHSETVLPAWAHWDYYSNMDQALEFSRLYYQQLDSSKRFSPGNTKENILKISTVPNLDLEFQLD